MKYEARPIPVEAVQFQLNERGKSTVFRVAQCECRCDAMDSYTCNQHGDPKNRSYALDFGHGGHINLGDWVVFYTSAI
jgi:hypothetical protein